MGRRSESGLTLVEVLATVIIGFLILLILYYVIGQSFNTYGKQITANQNLNKAAYALKVITKELRKVPTATVDENTCALTVGSKIYRFEAGTLYENNVALASDLQTFKATKGAFTEEANCRNEPSTQVSIKLVTNTNQVYATELILRKGG